MPPRRTSHVQPSSGPEWAFGQLLKQLREDRGLSQQAFALEGEFDRTTISLLERGLRSPTLRSLVRLAETLNISLPDMMEGFEALFYKGRKNSKRST